MSKHPQRKPSIAEVGELSERVEIESARSFELPKFESPESLLAAIVESSDDAIITKDLNGVITSWNRGAEHIFGYNAREAIGRSVTLLIPPEHINEEPHILDRIRHGERIDHYKTVRRRKDGSIIDVSLTVSPLKDASGKIIGASKIARDITSQQFAQENLRQSEERFRVTLASIGDAVIATDHEGRIEFMNSVAEKLTGWNQQQSRGVALDTVFNIINENSRQPVESPATRVFREGVVVGLANHTVLISKDGKEWPIDDSAAPIRGSNGDLTGVVLVFRDATRQRAAELTTRKLATIVENSDDAIISKDLNGIIMTWNRGAERIFGYTEAEVIGRPVSILIPPDHINEEPTILERIRRGERVDHYQTVRRRKNGSHVEISLTVSPLKDSSGKVIGASKIARDITEERRAHDRLRQSEERFRVTLASIGDAVIATDKEGRVTFINEVAEKLTGWEQKETIGVPLQNLFNIVNEITRHPVENPVTRVLREGTIVGLANHTILISKDGKEWPIDDSAAPIREPNEDLTGVVLVFRDATKQREAELAARKLVELREEQARELETAVAERTAQLRQTIADLEGFSSTVSHDLRSPLRAMQGFAQTVLTEYADKLDTQGRQYLERISNSAMRLDKLILEVLTYSQIGRNDISVEPIDLQKLVDEIVHTYPAIEESRAQIFTKRPLHPVLGSHASLGQCISNLLANAVKFVPAGAKPKVQIWTEKHDSKVQFFIEDNGIGIPENLVSKIFDPFQRAHPQAGYEGTGMGLAIVHKAVQRMRGTVGVRSRDGQGSTFWIELPAAG